MIVNIEHYPKANWIKISTCKKLNEAFNYFMRNRFTLAQPIHAIQAEYINHSYASANSAPPYYSKYCPA